MVIRTADGDVTTIDGREKAPRAMTPKSFWENDKPLAFDPARFSGLSAGVPGTPLTWARALKKYGTISLAEALRPGVRVATNGFTVDKTFFDSVEAVKTYFDDIQQALGHIQDVTGSLEGFEFWNGETGWPTDGGDDYGAAKAGTKNAEKYYHEAV